MVKNICTLGVFLFVFFFLGKSKERVTQSYCTVTHAADSISCIDMIIDNELVYRPFGQLCFTEKNLTDSIFKGMYREKCESGVGDELVYFSYTFYGGTSRERNKYTFMKLFQKDEYVPDHVEITSDRTPFRIKKEGQEIRIGYSKTKVAEILGIKDSNTCDTLRITDEDGTSDITLYFEANLLKKIVLQNYL